MTGSRAQRRNSPYRRSGIDSTRVLPCPEDYAIHLSVHIIEPGWVRVKTSACLALRQEVW